MESREGAPGGCPHCSRCLHPRLYASTSDYGRLQVRLPHIFAEAYAQKEDKTAPITLWGVSIDPASAKDARVSVILAKFVRARFVVGRIFRMNSN